MNNKEFITTLSQKSDYSTKDTTTLVNTLVELITNQLEEETSVQITGFGSFEVKKKLERILVNPQTKQRMLVPPKLVVNFKPNTSFRGEAK